MLISLFGSNFRSLRDPFELSMVAADLTRADDSNRGIIEVPLDGMDEPLKLLRAIGIFGHNGSGKSTILLAGHALNWIVKNSSARNEPGDPIQFFQPFMLNKETRDKPVTLGCKVILDTSILTYEISCHADNILRETLRISRSKSDVVLIDRNDKGQVKGELIEKSDANQLYVKGMQPNVAVLSKLAQHGPSVGADSVHAYYQAILDSTIYEDYSRVSEIEQRNRARARFADEDEYRNWIMCNLIAEADVGIDDVQTKRMKQKLPERMRKIYAERGLKMPEGQVVVSFIHKGADNFPLNFSSESAGTKKLFGIANDWWKLAHTQISFLADELSASLHPRLLDALVRAVNDAPPDRVRSQLLFSTHDVGLLEGQNGQPPALRRDQVYFTKKNSEGASELYSLAEFKDDARPVHNLRKRYLAGLYGAVPLLEKFSL